MRRSLAPYAAGLLLVPAALGAQSPQNPDSLTYPACTPPERASWATGVGVIGNDKTSGKSIGWFGPYVVETDYVDPFLRAARDVIRGKMQPAELDTVIFSRYRTTANPSPEDLEVALLFDGDCNRIIPRSEAEPFLDRIRRMKSRPRG